MNLFSKKGKNTTGIVFIFLAIVLAVVEYFSIKIPWDNWNQLMLDEQFWLNMMPFMYYLGFVVSGIVLLAERKFTIVVLFFTATMTIEEILSGFISKSYSVPFSIPAQIILGMSSIVALIFVFTLQKQMAGKNKYNYRMLFGGIAVGMLSLLAYELLFGTNPLFPNIPHPF